MKPGETTHLGDGAYLHFDGHSIEFRANHHEYSTDVVTIDGCDVQNLIHILRTTFESQNIDESRYHGCEDGMS